MSTRTPTTDSTKQDQLLTTLTSLRAERDVLVLALLAHIDSLDTASVAPSTSTSTSTFVLPIPSPNPTTTTSTPPSTTPPTQAQITRTLTFAKSTSSTHISRLHTYNEIKDVTQMLMGLVAEQRGVRVVEVMEEFGMGPKD